MDDFRDDASHASSSPFNSMNLSSPGSIDSNDINQQEPRQHAMSPRTELIVAERLEFELRQFIAEHARENRRLSEHYRVERDRADHLVDEFYQAELRRIDDEHIEAERLIRIKGERIMEERLCRIEVECIVDDLLRRIDDKHIMEERLRCIEDEREAE